ncbi:Uncharacterized protein SCG7109_AE_00390 [Chlamydiales bacterium SCGC AG-110-M15]|nr:Uncharacterized protein SCG7109_AE_00390 [Chlamydiales bacterium SCGC AG-110-M15]
MSDIYEKYKPLLEAVKVPLQDPKFHRRAHLYISKMTDRQVKSRGKLERVIFNERQGISYYLEQTGIQESCSFRNVTFAREIASLVINEKGHVDEAILNEAIRLLRDNLYSLGPNAHHDTPRNEHFLSVLELLAEKQDYRSLLRRVTKPFGNKKAEEIIRHTLILDHETKITDTYARRAVLSAWLTYLRQNVGSCFATAPAIIIQSRQAEQFLKDMIELLSKGSLKRTFGGIEYVVPLSQSWGAGDLKKPFQLNDQHSPGKCEGFYQALMSCGLVDRDLPRTKALRLVNRYILDLFGAQALQGWGVITDSKKILKGILTKHLNVTEEDLQQYALNQQKKGTILSISKHQEKDSCAQFHTLYEKAKTAFKQVTENPLLKSWEFTLASFTETKAEFSRWNLYASLGLAPDDGGGIGPIIYGAAKQRLQEMNERAHERQERYEQIYLIVKGLEQRLERADESEVRWLKSEYRKNVAEMNRFLEGRDRAHAHARRWANTYNFLIDIYNEKFKEYFQEVYDANMQDVSTGPYDDSPAGFRLVYKYGRTDTSLWTSIRDEEQFVDFLAEFFHRTESEISNLDELKGIETDFSHIVSLIVNQIRTPEFLETALYRMAKVHGGKMVQNPLQNLDKVDKKPWVYTSGGTMAHLVSCYYCNEALPQEEDRFVESETELLAFLAELMKTLPPNISQAYEKDEGKSMLIHSPTHAFLFKPGTPRFKKIWKSKEYTYTVIREQLVIPAQHFLRNHILNTAMQQELIRLISEHLQEPYRHLFKKAFSGVSGEKSPAFFRNEILQGIAFDKALQIRGQGVLDSEDIDSLLYRFLPLHLGHSAAEHIIEVIKSLPKISEKSKREMLELFEELSGRFSRYLVMDAKSLRRVILSLILIVECKPKNASNFHREVLEVCRERGLAMPEPIVFADTNWTKESFAFVVNPGTEELEMWKVETLNFEGTPMLNWKHWLDGSRKKPTWGVYMRPHEYGE